MHFNFLAFSLGLLTFYAIITHFLCNFSIMLKSKSFSLVLPVHHSLDFFTSSFFFTLYAPLDGNFKLYMHHGHRDPVKIFLIIMRNLLFRLLILFDAFDELQLIDKN